MEDVKGAFWLNMTLGIKIGSDVDSLFFSTIQAYDTALKVDFPYVMRVSLLLVLMSAL